MGDPKTASDEKSVLILQKIVLEKLPLLLFIPLFLNYNKIKENHLRIINQSIPISNQRKILKDK